MATLSYEKINASAKKLHEIFNNKKLTVYDCKNGDVYKMLEKIPHTGGLIVFFEKGETFCDMPRIVFVGETKNFHTRIKAYYTSHAKLVTHIRDALGNKLGIPVLQQDANKYIQENMSFALLSIPAEDKKGRIKLNKKILSTLSCCKDFKASNNWLGNYAPKEYELITFSRLWAVKYPFDTEIMEESDCLLLENLLLEN